MRISRRIISSKKHTVGYVLSDGRHVTRSEAVRMASKGNIDGVKVVRSAHPYIMSTTDRNLYDLPEIAQAKASLRRSHHRISR